ncbi:MAG: cell division protein SepF [Cyanobacteriota bacterium]
MSSGLVSKIKNFVGLSNYVDDEEDIFDELYRSESDYLNQNAASMDRDTSSRTKSNLKVVSHPNASNYEVCIIEPRSFDESLEIINNLRDRRSVVINLHLLDNEQSQRVVDFLSGATHAIDGHQQRIGEGVFLFTPANVAISAESDKSKAIRDSFWNHPQ